MKQSIIIGLILLQLTAFGQQESPRKALQVSGFIQPNKVLVRWAPEDPISWMRSNKFGYTVYRKTVMRDSKILDKPDSIQLGIYKPEPLDLWKPFADSSHFAIAAEAIFGNEFEVTTQSNSFFDMVNKSREQESRFTISLICADQSFTVACMMGLGLIDSTCKKNETYLYKVVANYSENNSTHEVGYCLVDFKVGNFLPKPFGIEYQTSQSLVTIMIPHEPFKGVYTNYELQRSEDGVRYYTVKDKSYFSLSTTTDDPKYDVYNDSVKYQASTLYYRLRGRTPFDTCGPYSDALSIKIMPSLDGEPWITGIKEVGNGKLMLNWEAPEYKKENLKGFSVLSSTSYQGPYRALDNSMATPEARFSVISSPASYAYYKVAALDQFNRPYYSSPRLYQAVDSIPPSSPTGLSGQFDTTGVVHLRWKYGKENDLLGYQVLYSSDSASEYSLIGKDFIYDSTYSAAFPTDMLSSKIFFKAIAFDVRYNTSKPSAPIKLIKPDKIPPASPFIMIETDSLGIVRVSVAPSRSLDIKLHHLYFEPEGDKSKLVELYRGGIKEDTTILFEPKLGKGNLFCVAEDVIGLKGFSNRVLVSASKGNVEKTFKAIAKPLIDDGVIELVWDKSVLVGNVMIYRKDENSNYSLISTVGAGEGEFKDRNVIVNTIYTYKLIANRKTGGLMSKVVEVKFK